MNSYHAEDINEMVTLVHGSNEAAGWWNDADFGSLKEGPILKYIVPTKLALCHSELSEGLEGFRKGIKDTHLTDRPMLEVELADTLIRIFDLAGALNLDLGGAVVEKMKYNSTRQDHRPENRAAAGGKSI